MKYVLHKVLEHYEMTEEENFNAVIINANKILKFKKSEGFETPDDCLEYVDKYFDISKNDVIVK